MKSFKSILIVAAIVFSINANAKIWRVNSNSLSDSDYDTIQNAIDAASANDTIHVEGGYYTGFTTNKPLVILGSGFGQQLNSPVENPMLVTYIITDITIGIGSDGLMLSGFNLKESNRNIHIKANELLITRNSIRQLLFSSRPSNTPSSIENVIISNNIINDVRLHYDQKGGDDLNVSNCIFSSNVFDNALSLSDYVYPVYGTYIYFSGTFKHNVFYSNNLSVNNSLFQNNIFYSTSRPEVVNLDYNNTVSYNVSRATWTADENYHIGSNNVMGATDIFKPLGAYYELSATSEAAGVGVSGVDCGIYGSTSPFVPGGFPAIPTITDMAMPSQVSGGSMQVDVKAKVIE
jgi:hypothetical protein